MNAKGTEKRLIGAQCSALSIVYNHNPNINVNDSHNWLTGIASFITDGLSFSAMEGGLIESGSKLHVNLDCHQGQGFLIGITGTSTKT